MRYQEFYYWCRDAVSMIKYTPDKVKVYTELYTHLEDRYESFLGKGLSEKEAEQMALAAMGDPKELAPQLAAIHKPHWAYAMVVTRAIVIVLLIHTLIRGVIFVHDLGFLRDKDLWDPFVNGTGERIVYVQPDVSDSSDGYHFEVKQATVWRGSYQEPVDGKTYFDQLFIQLHVSNPRPWMPEQEAVQWMWAVDSTGKCYASSEQANPTTEGWIAVEPQRLNLTTYRYNLMFQQTAEDIQWVELHYDRDGRDLVLRIDLTGGVGVCGA